MNFSFPLHFTFFFFLRNQGRLRLDAKTCDLRLAEVHRASGSRIRPDGKIHTYPTKWGENLILFRILIFEKWLLGRSCSALCQ